ncbi:MAG: diadenylate cyclase, partial [Planctomycetes bacterium]|nr:diadenylate cyclase [Planctomycetota bacterium]
ADDVDVGSVFLNIDAFEPPEVLSTIIDERTILVTAQREPPESLAVRAGGVISLPFAANNVAAMLRLAIVLAIGKRIISRKARVLALAGPVGSNTLDQMRLFNAKDFPTLDLDEHHSHAIQPGVLERVIEVASTIAREGREGEAVGTLFVIGDEGTLANYTRQLVINPFHGYPRSQLNILDVTLEETIKEFASIDGAFIVASDGAMLSAGTYLSPPQTADVELPSGLGTRHRSAAMLTLAVPCVAVVVSESTRTVSVFYGGKLALALDVGKAGAQSEAQ